MLQIWALEGIPEVTPGIDLVALIAEAATSTLQDGDIPPLATMFEDVFEVMPPHLHEQMRQAARQKGA